MLLPAYREYSTEMDTLDTRRVWAALPIIEKIVSQVDTCSHLLLADKAALRQLVAGGVDRVPVIDHYLDETYDGPPKLN